MIQIHLQHPPGDILVFMTGQEDILATCGAVSDRLEELGEGVPPFLVLPFPPLTSRGTAMQRVMYPSDSTLGGLGEPCPCVAVGWGPGGAEPCFELRS